MIENPISGSKNQGLSTSRSLPATGRTAAIVVSFTGARNLGRHSATPARNSTRKMNSGTKISEPNHTTRKPVPALSSM
jgi:hypothetical protein